MIQFFDIYFGYSMWGFTLLTFEWGFKHYYTFFGIIYDGGGRRIFLDLFFFKIEI